MNHNRMQNLVIDAGNLSYNFLTLHSKRGEWAGGGGGDNNRILYDAPKRLILFS